MPACNRLAETGVRVCVFPVIPYGSHYGTRSGISPALAVWIARHSSAFDIVHIHQTWGMAQVVALFAATRAGRATVVTPHESLTNYDVGHTRPAAKRILRDPSRRTSLLVLSSQRRPTITCRPSTGSAVRSPIIPSPNRSLCLDGGCARPATHCRVLGRLHERKTWICSSVPWPALQLTHYFASPVTGRPSRGRSWRRSRQTLESVIASSGWVSCRVVRRTFFDSIDLLAMPSRYECFGMAAAEAWLAECRRSFRPRPASPTGGAIPVRTRHGSVASRPSRAPSGDSTRPRAPRLAGARRGTRPCSPVVDGELRWSDPPGFRLLLDSGVAPLRHPRHLWPARRL